jgi:EmrB/QacA subfamily drug resistance transporter
MNELTMTSPRRRWAALAVLCLSLVVVTLDTTILNVALPSLVRGLLASASSLQWIVDSYTVVFAGLLLTAASLGDRFGRRGALAAGLGVFMVGCVGSALAHSPGALIALRALTGAGAALVFPATLSILTNVFEDPVERQRAIAVWAGTAGIGIALGPLTGGLLLRWFFWGSVFLVNIPICVVALIAGRRLVPTSRDPQQSPLDPIGTVLSIVGLSTLVYGIIEGPARGWTSGVVTGSFAVAGVVLLAFGWVELHREHPLLDLRLFANPRFTAASLGVTSLYFCLFGVIFLQTQHLQFVLGYDPLQAGLRSMPFAVVLLAVANSTPGLVRRFGTRAVVGSGLLIVAAAMAMRTGYTVDTTYRSILFSQCAFALGMGLTIAPATASIMGAVPAGRAGVGSAINDTTRQVGGALGVAVMGSVAASLYHRQSGKGIAALVLPRATARLATNSVGSALTAAAHLPAPVARAVSQAARSAFIHGADAASVVGVVVALVGVAVAVRFLPAGMRVGGAVAPERAEAALAEVALAEVALAEAAGRAAGRAELAEVVR